MSDLRILGIICSQTEVDAQAGCALEVHSQKHL